MVEQRLRNKANLVLFSWLTIVVLVLFRVLSAGESTDVLGPWVASIEQADQTPSDDRTVTEPILPKHHYYSSYKVQSGDSLYWIAVSYGISVEELKQLNYLEDDLIKVGQRLVVPLDLLQHYPTGVRLSVQEVELLAQMIYAEARGEPYLGQVAVGAVIINRMLSPQFPDTLRGVLFQANAFQPVRNGSVHFAADESARKAAIEALNGHDPTQGALYFFNPRKSTDRFMHSRVAKTTIGGHRFTN